MFSKSSGNEKQLVLCDCQINKGDPVFLDIGNHHPVSLFGGNYHSVVIGSEGEVIFINLKWSCFHISPIEEESSVLNFSIVSELSGQEIVCVSGTSEHFLAVSKEGHVFGLGSNKVGQLSLGIRTKSVSSFTKISLLEGYDIRAAYAGFNHSFFETREGNILACGFNNCGQLLLSSDLGGKFFSLTETTINSGVYSVSQERPSASFL